MAVNAIEFDGFEEVEVFGKPALFTCLRIDRDTVPEGVYKYSIRHDDEGRGDACELARWIMVNHWGDILTLEEINLGEDGFVLMNDEDINYATDTTNTLDDFIKKYKDGGCCEQ